MCVILFLSLSPCIWEENSHLRAAAVVFQLLLYANNAISHSLIIAI